MHYPWPKATIPEFQNYIITVSGYAGGARESIKRMIELLGGKFEGTMTKNKTTHVISASLSGSKVQHAQLWNVPVINHFWIEDCFLSWQVRSTAVSQYHSFEIGPKDLTFANLVGTRPISPQIAEQWSQRSEVQKERKRALSELAALLDMAKVHDRKENAGIRRETSPSASAPRSQKMVVQQSVVLPEPGESEVQRGVVDLDTTEIQPLDAMPEEPMPPTGETETLHERPPRDDGPPRKSPAVNGRKKRRSPEPSSSAASATPEPSMQVPRPTLEPPSSASTTVEVAASRSGPQRKKKRISMSELQRLDAETSFGSTPQGYSRRKAAAAATQKLHDTIMPDVLAYQEELKGGGKKRLEAMFGSPGPDTTRLKPSSASSLAKGARRAGSALCSNDNDSDVDSADNSSVNDAPRGTARAAGTKARKTQIGASDRHVRIEEPKGRLTALKQDPAYGAHISSDCSSFDAPPGKNHYPVLPKSKVLEAGGTIKIATTGVDLDEGMRKALARMKAQLIGSDLTGTTHMIVKGISRTVKFLQGISMGVYFVTERWAVDSINQAQFLGEKA